MTSMRLHLRILLLGVLCLIVPFTGALAQSDEAFVAYRQKVMQGIGANMGAIGETMKNKLPLESNIAAHAQQLEISSSLIESAFKKEVAAGKTDAKAEIWQDWDKFLAAAKELGKESGKLAQVAQSGDMAALEAQVKAVSKTCGDCHKPFRKPKEESYKRQQ